MRLGAPLLEKTDSPESWVEALRKRGYSAAFCPVGAEAPDDVVRAYEQIAVANGIVIAEVGAWSSPMSPDEAERKTALELCQRQLDLADRIGARCCVNIAGSLGEKWDGPHPDNLGEACFERIVETTRTIIDAVKPTRTVYTLETMPWVHPDSPETYLRLLKAIDRPAFAVHLDPVNMVNSIHRAYDTAALLRDSFQKLGPYIRSCHAKDIVLEEALTLHLNEGRPGTGVLDYATYLRELSQLDDVPLMMEHMTSEEDYAAGAAFIRQTAAREGLAFV